MDTVCALVSIWGSRMMCVCYWVKIKINTHVGGVVWITDVFLTTMKPFVSRINSWLVSLWATDSHTLIKTLHRYRRTCKTRCCHLFWYFFRKVTTLRFPRGKLCCGSASSEMQLVKTVSLFKAAFPNTLQPLCSTPNSWSHLISLSGWLFVSISGCSP